MNPGTMLFANRSFAFHLYDFNLEGISVEKLAATYSLSIASVQERIESVRLCIKYQTKPFISAQSGPSCGSLLEAA
jgi:hypothetical protein